MKKILAFDLDDTLCYRPKDVEHMGADKYYHCKPIPDMIELLNDLYDKGHLIYIYTARGMTTFDGNVKLIYENLYDLTLKSLEEWGVKHHGLYMGKLHYDWLIDDKALNLNDAKIILKKL